MYFETEQMRQKTKQKLADFEIAKCHSRTWETRLELAKVLKNLYDRNDDEIKKTVKKLMKEVS